MIWIIRSTPREALGRSSPYETITEMKPCVPLEHFASPCGESKMLRNSYASELVEYLNYFYKYVDERCITAREARDHAYLREHCVSEHLREGEYYLLQKTPERICLHVSNRSTPTKSSRM